MRASQVKARSPRKRAGTSSVPPVEADAANVVWALDFQFDSTMDGQAVKIASTVDEHTRESLLHLAERSITAERLVDELPRRLRPAGWPADGAAPGQRARNDLAGTASVLRWPGRLSYIPPGTPWNNGFIESFNNRLRRECLNRNAWTNLLEARVVIGDFKDEHNTRHRHSSLGYRTPAEYAATCRCTHQPVTCEID